MSDKVEAFAILGRDGLLDRYPHLYIADRPKEKEVEILKQRLKKAGTSDLVTPNSVFVFGKSSMDIQFGSEFNVLFSDEEFENFLEVNATLKYANEHPNYESTVVPKGYTGVICLIEFEGAVPEMIDALSIHLQQKWDKSKAVYLSQKPIHTRLMELTDPS